jgi:predicted dehydrogenase
MSKDSSSKTPVRIALIGTGGINKKHAQCLSLLEGVEVVGVSGNTPERTRAFSAETKVPAFEHYEKMLDEARPDAVIVGVPPHAHVYEEACVARGLHLLVEKPLSNDYATAERISEAVTKARVVSSVGYHMRYWAALDEVRRLLKGRTVFMAEGGWMDTTPPPLWWQNQKLSGGQVIEQTTHIFDLLRYVLGEVRQVSARALEVRRTSHPECDVDGAVRASVVFADGALGEIVSTHLLKERFWVGIRLFCTDGLVLELSEATKTTPRRLVAKGAESFERTYDDDPKLTEDRIFVEAVRTRKTQPGAPVQDIRSDYADALKSHRLATLAAQSARAQGAVTAVP